jgi:hypothetical protein
LLFEAEPPTASNTLIAIRALVRAAESAGNVPGVAFVDVRLTDEPRRTPEMMSPEAKAYLGIR